MTHGLGASRERMSQIMELIWLAPDIQQEILAFPPTKTTRFPISELAVRKIASAFCWREQRADWNRLRAKFNLTVVHNDVA